MKALTSRQGFGSVPSGGILSIGNFDGVHAGHRAILRHAKDLAGRRKAPLIVMTFDPHPAALLYPERAPKVLSPLPWKLHLLSEVADFCLIIGPDERDLFSLTPARFVDEFLMTFVKPAVVVEGDDFHFGAGRAGTVETLGELGLQRGFDVEVVGPYTATVETGHTMRISSTVVRYMLEAGHVREAAGALGRPFRLYGPVVAGRGKGRQIGYPTLNMKPGDQVTPAEGVYAAFIRLGRSPEELFAQDTGLPAAVSVGQARTFGDEHPLLIESHVLVSPFPRMAEDWIAVDFVEHLRNQHKFGSVEQLVAQIGEDCRRAREILTAPGIPLDVDGIASQDSP